jgi:hypothetical protein
MTEYKIGERVFRTKTEAIKTVQLVLQSSQIGKALSGSELQLIQDLLVQHPAAEEKLSGGCKAIVTRINKLEGMPAQRGFWIVRDDNTEIDFSIHVPFKSTEVQRKKDQLHWAAREAVRPSVQAFKQKNFQRNKTVQCAISGVAVTWTEAQVHHAPPWPFIRIVTEWLTQKKVTPVVIDLGITKALEDKDEFIKFHDARAVLQIVHQRENARLGARQ